MKNFVRFLVAIFAVFFVSSCEYDDNFIIDEHDGKDGKDGRDTVEKIEAVKDATGRNGIKVTLYWDDNRDGVYNSGDTPKNISYVLWDGINGEPGKTPTMNYGILPSATCTSGSKLFFASSLDGKPLGDTVYFCVPSNGINGQDGEDGEEGQNGLNGLTPTLQTIVYPYGITYIWYMRETKISEYTITNGKDGNPATSIVSLTLEYNFQGAGTSYFNSTGFILDNFVLNEGALYLDKSSGSVALPPFSQNMDLLSLRFNYGSKKPYDVTVKAVYADNSEETIKTVNLEGNPTFDRNVYATYSQFEYYANLEDIQFKDIKAIKIYGTLSGKCVPEDLFIDQVVICLRDRNVH